MEFGVLAGRGGLPFASFTSSAVIGRGSSTMNESLDHLFPPNGYDNYQNYRTLSDLRLFYIFHGSR